MADDIPELPTTPAVAGSSKLAAIFNFFQDPNKKKYVVLGVFLVFAATFSWWAHQGFTLNVSRFFAAGNGPELTYEGEPHTFSHQEQIHVLWSKNDAVECHSLSGGFDTGGQTTGDAYTAPVNACTDRQFIDLNVECSFSDGSVGNTVKRVFIDTNTCPTGGGTPTPTPAPTATPGPGFPNVNFSSDKTAVNFGDTVTLTWSSDGTSCTGAGAGFGGTSGGPLPPSGNVVPNPLAGTTTFGLTCINAAGNTTGRTVTVTVNAQTTTPTPVGGGGGGGAGACTKNELNGTVNPDGTGSVTNHSSGSCDVWLVSYNIWKNRGGTAPHYLEQQTIFSQTKKTLTAGQTTPINVSLPACYYQLDLLTVAGAVPVTSIADVNLVAFNFGGNEKGYCDALITPTPGTPTPTRTPTPTVTSTPPPQPVRTPTPPVGSPVLTIDKTVEDITLSGAAADVISANPSDVVKYTIKLTSSGTVPVTGVNLKDVLPFGTTYMPGSATVAGVTVSDLIITSGLPIGDIPVGQTITITFKATIDSANSFSVGTTTLTNIATATSTNYHSVSDNAYVNVFKQGVGGSSAMILQKFGNNVSQGQSGEYSSVNAVATNLLQFIIHVKSTGSAPLTNVIIKDVMPDKVTYVPGSTKVNGASVNDNIITSAGLNIGTLAVGAEAIITLNGKVTDAVNLPTGNITVINTAKASADNQPEIIAQLPITITKDGNPSQVPTGAGESLVMAILISGILTFMYVSYTQTGLFRRRQVGSMTKGKSEGVDLK